MATRAQKAVAKAAVEAAREKAAEAPKFVEAIDVLMALALRAKSKGDSAANVRRQAAEAFASGYSARSAFDHAARAARYEAEAVVWGRAVRVLLDAPEDGFKGGVADLLDETQHAVEHVASYLAGNRYGADGSAEGLAYQGRLDAHTEIRRELRFSLRRADRNGLLDDRNTMSAAAREKVEACIALALMSASSVEK